MICGLFHSGSGMGDQLFRYITVRTLAQARRFDWGMCNPQLFKGDSFMNLDMGSPVLAVDSYHKSWHEKDVRDAQGNDIRSYDPEINFVENYTLIDGSFEDSKYWAHNLDNISKWLAVEPLNVPDDLCVIGFRGGEYYADSDLGLPKDYFEEAVRKMREINASMRFEVHTDDTTTAMYVLAPLFRKGEVTYIANAPVSHSKHVNMGFNWRSARHAKYAIIPNSAFFILPRLLKHHEDRDAITIAPRYWARRNTKIWARPACYYESFKYI